MSEVSHPNSPTSPLHTALVSFLARYQPTQTLTTPWTIAYSGGLDSTVLLHALATFAPEPFPLAAVHVQHGLSPHAGNWASHCERFCQSLDIPLQVVKIQPPRSRGTGPEAAARHARYAALTQAAKNIWLAHHREDQAETVLLRLLRGCGTHGAGGMAEQSTYGESTLWRPLLHIPSAELLHYAHTHHLSWIEDESNDNTTFARNYLRHNVYPLLEERFAATANLARFASHSREAAALLDELALIDQASCAVADTPKPDTLATLAISTFLALSEVRQKNLLRYLLRQAGAYAPATVRLQEALRQLRLATTRRGLRRWSLGAVDLCATRDTVYMQRSPRTNHASSSQAD